ncbi:hypothetical protein CLCR_02159 [Cladophialophora carrionii]|uniref:Uncharacterized protein n=1 Tax=Cladophialophora carrionii TaxID=86049 RepID=A0A1C1CDG4_9EURO|nr:hypothetical protein CLCR_02159 [Cladophialophora carrionii]
MESEELSSFLGWRLSEYAVMEDPLAETQGATRNSLPGKPATHDAKQRTGRPMLRTWFGCSRMRQKAKCQPPLNHSLNTPSDKRDGAPQLLSPILGGQMPGHLGDKGPGTPDAIVQPLIADGARSTSNIRLATPE